MDNKKDTSNLSLDVVIRTPEALLFQGQVQSLSSVNERGPFDVLPMHESFISIISTVVRVKTKTGETKEFKVDRGVLRAYKNHIDIFLGIEALAPQATG